MNKKQQEAANRLITTITTRAEGLPWPKRIWIYQSEDAFRIIPINERDFAGEGEVWGYVQNEFRPLLSVPLATVCLMIDIWVSVFAVIHAQNPTLPKYVKYRMTWFALNYEYEDKNG